MKAVVVGSAPQGLFMLRQLSQAGFDVTLVSCSKKVAWHSKYGEKYFANSPKDLINELKKIYIKNGNIPCHITSGAELQYICDHYPELFDCFDVFPKPLKSVQLLLSKKSTYNLAGKLGLDILKGEIASDILTCKKNVKFEFPLIVKWNSEINAGVENNFKTQVVYSQDELHELFNQFTQHQLDNLIVQPFITSNQDRNISVLGYYNNGKLIAFLVAQQKRQYPKGITSYLVEYTGEHSSKLVELSRMLISSLNYTGFAEVEFKFEDSFKIPYLLEVNPRTCGWSSAFLLPTNKKRD